MIEKSGKRAKLSDNPPPAEIPRPERRGVVDKTGRPGRSSNPGMDTNYSVDLMPPQLDAQPRVEQHEDKQLAYSDESSGSLVHHTIRGMTGWMISMVLHLAVILLLAVFTLGVAGKKPISLLINQPASSDDLVTFDIVIDADAGADLQLEIETAKPMELVEEQDLEPVLTDALQVTGPQSLRDDYEPISSSGVERILNSANDGNREGAQFFGVKGKGSRFVFIIDCSGSMDEYNRWRRAVRELKSSINNLMEPQQFLVLLYNSYTVAMNNQDAKLVKANRENQATAINWLTKQTPFGSTYVATSLKTAFEIRPDAIFLLSDGEFDDLALVKSVLQHYNGPQGRSDQVSSLESPPRRKIPVHTISLGGKSGAWTMRDIAEQNHGTHTVIDD